MWTQYADVPGNAGFELLVVLAAIIYTGYKFLIALLSRDREALKFYLPATLLVAWIWYEGDKMPLLLLIMLVITIVWLCYKGNTAKGGLSDENQESQPPQNATPPQKKMPQKSFVERTELPSAKAYALMERTVVDCPQCGQKLALPSGRTLNVTCPKCGHIFIINT